MDKKIFLELMRESGVDQPTPKKIYGQIEREIEFTKAELEKIKVWGFAHINSYPKNVSFALPMTWQIVKKIKAEDKALLHKISQMTE